MAKFPSFMRFALAIASTLAVAASASSIDERQASPCAGHRGISRAAKTRVLHSFNQNDIIPEIVPRFTPTSRVQVIYPNAAAHLGNEVALNDTAKEPTIDFTAERGHAALTNYTVVMFDPDAPTPQNPTIRSFLHMLKYNERATCAPQIRTKTVEAYMRPAPPSVAVHRYIFLILRQPKGTFVPRIPAAVRLTRQNFNVKQFIAQNQLAVVGGNYFVSGVNS